MCRFHDSSEGALPSFGMLVQRLLGVTGVCVVTGACATRLPAGPLGFSDEEGASLPADERMFDEVLHLLREGPVDGHGDTVLNTSSHVVRCQEQSPESLPAETGFPSHCVGLRLAGFGLAFAHAAARAYLPEFVSERKDSGAHLLTTALSSVMSWEAARAMLGMDDAGFVGTMCDWLGARLEQMPWVGLLRRMSVNELLDLMARLDIMPLATTETRVLVAHILSSVSPERLSEDLAQPGTPRLARLTLAGSIHECPEEIRTEFAILESRRAHGVEAPAVYAAFGARLQGALSDLGGPAIRGLAEKYIPESPDWRGEPAASAKSLTRLLISVVPPGVVVNLLSLDDAGLFDTLCYWLGVRLEQMPWAQALAQLPLVDLQRLASKMRVEIRVAGGSGMRRRRLVAKMLRLTSKDPTLLRELLRELAATGSLPPAVDGDIRECPSVVRDRLRVRTGTRSRSDGTSVLYGLWPQVWKAPWPTWGRGLWWTW